MSRLIAWCALYAALAGNGAFAQGTTLFTFGAFGDIPYTQDEEARFPDFIAEMNRESLAFVIHVGDFKSAHSACTDDVYRERRRWFGLSRAHALVAPGAAFRHA